MEGRGDGRKKQATQNPGSSNALYWLWSAPAGSMAAGAQLVGWLLGRLTGRLFIRLLGRGAGGMPAHAQIPHPHPLPSAAVRWLGSRIIKLG